MFAICLIIFLFSPTLSIVTSLIGILFSKKPFLYCILIALSLGLIAFAFEPTKSHDLFRIYQKVEWLKVLDFNKFLSLYANNLEIVFNFFLYLISKFLDKHFIPAIFSFVGYLIMFYIICDYSKIKKATPFQTVFVIICFILFYQHMYLISGIRNFIAIIFFVGLLYLEKVKKKENLFTHLLYLIPLFCHSSMLVFILFRFLIEIKSAVINKIVILGSIIVFFIPQLILQVLSLFQGNSFLSNLYLKMRGYLTNDLSYYSFLILLAMFLLYALYIYLYNYTSKKVEINQYYTYLKYMLFLSAGVLMYNVIFDRILVLLSCLSVILLIDYITNIKHISIYNKFLCYSVILLISAFTFRNQVHNYYPDIKSAINITTNNNVVEIINSVR